MLFATKMEDTSERGRFERTVATLKYLRNIEWKCFGFYIVNGKVTNKNKAVNPLCSN